MPQIRALCEPDASQRQPLLRGPAEQAALGRALMNSLTGICPVRPLLLVGLSLLSPLVAAAERPAAETIITNAKVWTVDRNHQQAEAVAILGNRIVAVGTEAEIDGWRGQQTRIIDAAGKLLLPGFNDAHVHFISGSMQLDQVQLNDARTKEEFVRRISEQAKKTPKGEWILGGDWDEQNWAEQQPNAGLPTREWIDAVTPNAPVFVNRHDGHEALANSLALKLAGITAKTQAPAGGEIVHDAQGTPTGLLQHP